MDGTFETKPARIAAPWHIWVVGILSLLWNAFGAYDYTMSQLRNPAYLESTMGPMGISVAEASAWLDSFPAWATCLWAIGVWGSMAGSILILMRSRWAVWAFAVSFVGAAINFAYETTTDQLPQIANQPLAKFMPLVIIGAIVMQWWYAWRQAATRVLR